MIFNGEVGLNFFGKIVASISHDIKNVIAIINENAGLLEDLSFLAEKGVPIEPEKLKNVSGKIIKQVGRADAIIKNMNKFSHSVDESIKQIDLNEVINIMIELSKRSASMKGVIIESYLSNTIFLTTNPFFLEILIYKYLAFAMESSGKSKTVFLKTEKSMDCAHIIFGNLDGINEATNCHIEEELIKILKIKVVLSMETKELILKLPVDIEYS